MLVLSRGQHERIVMPFTAKTLGNLVKLIPVGQENDDETPIVTITVVVAEIKPNVTRLGVDAPKSIPVHREELYEKIHCNLVHPVE